MTYAIVFTLFGTWKKNQTQPRSKKNAHARAAARNAAPPDPLAPV